MILAFAHPAIVVDDLERARAFYESMFGFRVIANEGWEDAPEIDAAIGSQGSACRGYILAGHNCHLELFEYSRPAPSSRTATDAGPHEPGIRHLAFFVDDCEAELARLIKLGGRSLGVPTRLPGGHHAVYARDPFGNIIELTEIPGYSENPLGLPGVNSLGDYHGD